MGDRDADEGVRDTGLLDLQEIVSGLRTAREKWRNSLRSRRELGSREFPSPDAIALIVDGLRGVLFPLRLGPADLRRESEDYFVGHALDTAMQSLLVQVILELRHQARQQNLIETSEASVAGRARQMVRDFARSLPGLRESLDVDVRAAFDGDPAAGGVDEVLLCYPGIEAMIHYRMAHRLYKLGLPLIARLITEKAHGKTGIDIHPGAEIGEGFFIDHGTGVVIGETAVIGARVRVYQAVTLGAKRFPKDESGRLKKGHPRHPVVEDDVVIYAGATILGRVTIGKGSTVGGNVWLTQSVPPGSNITQATTQEQRGDAAPAA
jgi:serine O-acetyltransferase